MANQDNLFQKLLSSGPNRKYLMEVRTTDRGDRYLVIDEIRRGTATNAGLSSIYVFQDIAPEFLAAIQEALQVVLEAPQTPPTPSNADLGAAQRAFWTKARKAQLETDFYAGRTLDQLAAQFNRPADEIRLLLGEMGIVVS